MTMILKMNGLWILVNRDIHVPSYSNLAVEHNLKDMKARCIILDVVRGQIIPHISRKGIGRQTWVALVNLAAQGQILSFG